MKRIKYIIAILGIVISQAIFAQNQTDDIIFKALTDEMSRNLSGLKLGQNPSPFLINEYLSDFNYLLARASMGGLINSAEYRSRQGNSRIMLGNYSINDENFVSGARIMASGGVNLALPRENDYAAIRRSYWTMLDRTYKSSIDNYMQKLTALKQLNKSEERTDDYTKVSPIVSIQPTVTNKYDKAQWENNLRELSGVLKNYPNIQKSSVDLLFYSSNNYVVNTEGTKIKVPMNVSCVVVSASTQAPDGELVRDFVYFYTPLVDQLPAMNVMKEKIKTMAENLQNKAKSPIINEAYQGPVIIEADALAELINAKFFGNDGLIARREPIYGSTNMNPQTNKTENKIGRRIFSENINITATPKQTTFGSTPLVGTFTIDGEGVIPADELKIVDKGILKTLLNDRTPTAKVKESNGYSRLLPLGNRMKTPGVINVSYEKGLSYSDLKKLVSEETLKNSMEYFYIIRKLETSNFNGSFQPVQSSGLTKPVEIVKVNAKTGEEQPIRCANISEFPTLSFKYTLGGTSEQVAYNSFPSLVPASYIVPRAIAFNDISIEKDNSPKSKLPIVPNPMAEK